MWAPSLFAYLGNPAMADVTVTVTKTFEYRGRVVRRGSSVAMSPLDAAIAERRGDVTLVRGAVIPPDPEPEPPQPRRRRQYRRRDLVAEGTQDS